MDEAPQHTSGDPATGGTLPPQGAGGTLPRLLPDFPLIAGRLKADYTDFLVEEVPLYPCDGVGTHTYFVLEKAGLSTAIDGPIGHTASRCRRQRPSAATTSA